MELFLRKGLQSEQETTCFIGGRGVDFCRVRESKFPKDYEGFSKGPKVRSGAKTRL